MRACLFLLFLALALVSPRTAETSAQETDQRTRLALVIGVADYDGDGRIQPGREPAEGQQSDLENPINDVNAVAERLRGAGFELHAGAPILNADFAAMNSALVQFVTAVVEADAAAEAAGAPAPLVVVYFAGHGMQFAQSNYLIPARTTLPSAATMQRLPYAAARQQLQGAVIDANQIVALFADRPAGETLIILDACRDNIWARRARGTRTASVERGLEPFRPTGSVLVVTSAEPGTAALDGRGDGLSPFARAFMEHAFRPELSFLDAMSEITAAVRTRTSGEQRPYLAGSPERRFCLPGCVEPSPRTAQATLTPISPDQAPDARQTPPNQPAPLVRSEDVPRLRDFALFRECEHCPEMVVVPAGTFLMGSPQDEANRDDDEDNQAGAGGEQVQVSLRRFAIGRFEVTAAEWFACVDAGGGCYDRARGRQRVPVVALSWNDARTYFNWLNQQPSSGTALVSAGEAGPYRLLSEAEWEYAARATSTTRYSWGDQDPVCEPDAVNGANFRACDDDRARPVGSSGAANRFGLFDMHGNVYEWVQDCYATSYAALPNDGSAHEAENCSLRVLRGRSWNYYPEGLRSAARGKVNTDFRYVDIGFRVARTL